MTTSARASASKDRCSAAAFQADEAATILDAHLTRGEHRANGSYPANIRRVPHKAAKNATRACQKMMPLREFKGGNEEHKTPSDGAPLPLSTQGRAVAPVVSESTSKKPNSTWE